MSTKMLGCEDRSRFLAVVIKILLQLELGKFSLADVCAVLWGSPNLRIYLTLHYRKWDIWRNPAAFKDCKGK